MTLLIEPNQTIVFAGDSITDAGRTMGVGPLGDGYVRMVADLFAARYPQNGVKTINTGIGGFTSRAVNDLWDEHVLAPKSDWITLMVGINDCGFGFHPELNVHAVGPQHYEKFLRLMIERALNTEARMVLLDPFYIVRPDDATPDQTKVLEALADYLGIVESLAATYGTLHVRTHEIFAEQLLHRPASDMCPEPVHPNPAGHAVIAHALLSALGW